MRAGAVLKLGRNQRITDIRKAAVQRMLGHDGNRIIWLLLFTVLPAGFGLEIWTCWGKLYGTFGRAGALLTAIFVPWFTFMFGRLTTWRSHIYAEQARIESKKMFGWLLQAKATERGLDRADEIDRVLKLSPQEQELASTIPTIELMEKASMKAFAIALFIVTLVWGFGDLIAGAVRKLMVTTC